MNYRLMVVDDSRVAYAEMKKLLTDSSYEIVHYCRTGEEALEAYSQVQPDLVTMDIVMPGIDGLETAHELLSQWPDARVLMVSSLAYDDTINMAAQVGAKGFVFKPFDADALLGAIQTALT